MYAARGRPSSKGDDPAGGVSAVPSRSVVGFVLDAVGVSAFASCGQQAGNRRYLSDSSMALLYPDRDKDGVAAISVTAGASLSYGPGGMGLELWRLMVEAPPAGRQNGC